MSTERRLPRKNVRRASTILHKKPLDDRAPGGSNKGTSLNGEETFKEEQKGTGVRSTRGSCV